MAVTLTAPNSTQARIIMLRSMRRRLVAECFELGKLAAHRLEAVVRVVVAAGALLDLVEARLEIATAAQQLVEL